MRKNEINLLIHFLIFLEKGIAGEPEERPSFLHALRDVSVEEGQPLVLSAPFIGNPIPDVSWTKDDRPITANERILLTCDGKKVKNTFQILACQLLHLQFL